MTAFELECVKEDAVELSLLEARLLKTPVIGSKTDYQIILDKDWEHLQKASSNEDEEQKHEQSNNAAINDDDDDTDTSSLPVEVKTLVWEVTNFNEESKQDDQLPPFHIVTACQMDDKVDMSKLSTILYNSGLLPSKPTSTSPQISLAPRDVAERLTDFQSGTMPPICHAIDMRLFVEETTVANNATQLVSLGSGMLGKSLVITKQQMLDIAATTNSQGIEICNFSKSRRQESIEDASLPRKFKYGRQPPKDRLAEYRSMEHSIDRAKLLRSTARRQNRFDDVQTLVQEAVDTNDFVTVMKVCPQRGPDRNALHLAAWKGDLETVRLLINTAAQFEETKDIINRVSVGDCNYGKTPIFFSLTQCREKLIRFLLDKGASLLIVNNKGQTPCSIAPTHVSKELCKYMYEQEAQQLKAGGKFINYRASQSDELMYGDLDPRFAIDSVNMGEDVKPQIEAYQKSLENAPGIIDGVPTQFSPRSLRPTTRWWKRDDAPLERANLGEGPVITFTQSRQIHKNLQKQNKMKLQQQQQQQEANKKLEEDMMPDLASMELLTLADVLVPHQDSSASLITFVDSVETVQLLDDEVSRTLAHPRPDSAENETNSEEDAFILEAAWGLDCEWKPGPSCGKYNPVETLQLSSRSASFVVDVHTVFGDENMTEVSQKLDSTLCRLLSAQEIPLVGFGILQDIGKLAASFPHVQAFRMFESVIDLPAVTVAAFPKTFKFRFNMASLSKTVAVLMRKRLDKEQQCSDWTHRPLSEAQLHYGALDAAALPALLSSIMDHNASFADAYNGKFFTVQSKLRTSLRFVPLVDDLAYLDGFVYEVPMGSVKDYLGQSIARQTWHTCRQKEPPLPTQIPATLIEERFTKRQEERAARKAEHHDKFGTKEKRRAGKMILSDIAGNLDYLPAAGMTLGYTKDSCINRVVGHTFLNTLPSNTHLSYQRRGGVVQMTNAFVLFVNFGGKPAYGRYENEFTEGGRFLNFSITPEKRGPRGRTELDLYEHVVDKLSITDNVKTDEVDEGDQKEEKSILLFARASTKSKYVYCGRCECVEMKNSDPSAMLGSVELTLALIDVEQLIGEDAVSEDFENMVRSRDNVYKMSM